MRMGFLTRARGSSGVARRWWQLAPAVDEWGERWRRAYWSVAVAKVTEKG